MPRSKTSKAWMREHVTDAYVQRAKREGYRSRAAYKLQEIARQDRIIAPGMTVVDLGASPGGWSQVAAELVGPKGKVIAVDLLRDGAHACGRSSSRAIFARTRPWLAWSRHSAVRR